MKVDLRVCLKHGDKLFDACNIEFARNGEIERKNVTDAAKIMIEGKCILDQIVKVGKLAKDKAKCVEVLNAQFCGNFILQYIDNS